MYVATVYTQTKPNNYIATCQPLGSGQSYKISVLAFQSTNIDVRNNFGLSCKRQNLYRYQNKESA